MSADPAIIAKYTRDGITLTFQDDLLKAANPNAVDGGEIPTYFRYQADCQAMLDERAAILSAVGGPHEAVEVSQELGVGTRIPVTPIVPSFRAIDATRSLDDTLRVRATSFDGAKDKYSVEMVK